MGFVYIFSTPNYEVGHYDGAGVWVVESTHATKPAAIRQVHFLNGGSRS